MSIAKELAFLVRKCLTYLSAVLDNHNGVQQAS